MLYIPANLFQGSRNVMRCLQIQRPIIDSFLKKSFDKKATISSIHWPQDAKNYNLITDIVEPWVKKKPDGIALWLSNGESHKKVTYSELFLSSWHFASALCSHATPPPKCALVILPKIAPWWTINLAGSWCGMIISPSPMMITAEDIIYRLKACDSDAIICDADNMMKLDNLTKHIKWRIVADDCEEKETASLCDGWVSYHQLLKEGAHCKPISCNNDGNSIAQLFFTSGTTGKPKMVAHSQASYGLGHIATVKKWLTLRPDDVLWNLSDLGWAKSAYSCLYAPLIAGCTAFVHQMPRFDAHIFCQTLEIEPISVLCCPPTALRLAIQLDLSNFAPKALRKCVCAGEALNPEVNDMWKKYTGLTIYEGYGQTETTVSACSHEASVKVGSMGKSLTEYGYNIIILDDDLNELPSNEEGILAISLKDGWPIGLCEGYYKDPDKTEKTFTKDYYLSGDRGFKDDDGFIWYVGRNDDIIISAGYRIGPVEIESCIIKHPAVVESAVVATPDAKRGNVVKAFIVLNRNYEAEAEENPSKLVEEIQDFVKRNISPYKYPRKIEFVESLPKTVSGKIQRNKLRAKEMEEAKR